MGEKQNGVLRVEMLTCPPRTDLAAERLRWSDEIYRIFDLQPREFEDNTAKRATRQLATRRVNRQRDGLTAPTSRSKIVIMRTTLILGLALVIAACGERRPATLDGSSRIDTTQPQPDGEPTLKLDSGGGSFTYHGRVYLGHSFDPLVNTPRLPVTAVGFATVFYEPAFAPAQSAGACRFGQVMPPPPAVTNFLDAGAVSVTGGLVPINFTYLSSSAYYADDLKDGVYTVFNGGETLKVKGAGGPKLPAFSGQVPAPAALKVTTPDLFKATSIDTSKDYAVTWTPLSADRVRVVISCNGPWGEYHVACDSADDGALALPSQLLKALAPKCSAAKAAQVSFTRLNERHVEQGELRVTLQAFDTIQRALALK